MKKQIISTMTLVAAMTAGLTACSSDDSRDSLSAKQKMTINVTESQGFLITNGMPQADNMTRAMPATDPSDTNIKAGTTFETGDAIGIYEVSDGVVTQANVPYYFSGTVWDSSTEITFSADKTYYAYFPYQESAPTGAPALNSSVSASDAATFFSSLISNWTVIPDQSSYENYKASDLMVGQGTRTVAAGGNTVMNFEMSHQMGLVVLGLGQVKHVLRSGNYYWFDEVNRKCKGSTGLQTYYKPSYILEEYRAIVPVGEQAKFCATDDEWAVNANVAQRGHYQYYTIGNSEENPTAGIKYFELQLGDIYYSDGSLMHVTADNNDARMARQAEAEGFVVFVSDGSAEDQKVVDPTLDSNGKLTCTYSHGLVMRIAVNDTHNSNLNYFNSNSNIGAVTKAYVAAGHSVKTYYSVAAAINDYDGARNSSQVVGTNSTYDAWYTNAHPGPAGSNVPTSGWFIPGMGQLVHSLLQTGVIDQTIYNSMLQDATNAGYYEGMHPEIWQTYMTNAVGATSLAGVNTFTKSDSLYGLLTSTYMTNGQVDGTNYLNWQFCCNVASGYLYSSFGNAHCGGYTCMMLAF